MIENSDYVLMIKLYVRSIELNFILEELNIHISHAI